MHWVSGSPYSPMKYCLSIPVGRASWFHTIHKQHGAALLISTQFISTWCAADGSSSRTWQESTERLCLRYFQEFWVVLVRHWLNTVSKNFICKFPSPLTLKTKGEGTESTFSGVSGTPWDIALLLWELFKMNEWITARGFVLLHVYGVVGT